MSSALWNLNLCLYKHSRVVSKRYLMLNYSFVFNGQIWIWYKIFPRLLGVIPVPKPGKKKSDINRIQSGWPSCQLKMGKMKLQFTKLNNRKLESDLKKFRLAGGGVMVWGGSFTASSYQNEYCLNATSSTLLMVSIPLWPQWATMRPVTKLKSS